MKSRLNNTRRRGRIGVSIVVAGALALGLAACSGGASASSGLDGSTLKMYTWIGGKADKQQWSDYIAGGKHADPEMAVSFTGPPIGDYYTKLPTVMRGSSAPCLVTFQNGRVNQYVQGLEPLDGLAKKNGLDLTKYSSAMLDQLSDDGKLYAIPFNAGPTVMFYNKKLFKAAGVAEPTNDWTTEDFIAAAKATTKDGVYGFAIPQGSNPISTLMAADGHPYADEKGPKLDDPNFREALQLLVDLSNKYKVAKPLEAAAGGTFPDIDAFSTGQSAMEMQGLWDLQHEQQALGKDNVGIAVIPSTNGTSKGFIGGSGFGITKTCGDKQKAFKAIEAMTSKSGLEFVTKSQASVPARLDALDAWSANAGSPEFAAVIKQMTGDATPSPVPSNQSQLDTLLTQYEVNAFSGKSTVAEVLQQVKAGLTQ
ncbi:carbohydrate ABC transporter substrate-binding protein (CUT1 family) [Curtobacterium flaccumfaciens]|uniref:Carbohydrate ABC transporter substrate-binding protein (CUT1 family) n=1 Tax=Curtobacterium flaccumfaciens TaxID=2035 RepID=A0A4R6DIM2_9MICO|nr:sugar ABC transporter substrate-binding protein [Curtobacterium flaccumfaciens]TDN44615.1 carbohydrate ABC transporter substrate-binding protein (CUT1 family) [Curtobacterium flaccumfaciens]